MSGDTAEGAPGSELPEKRPPRVFLSYAHDDAEHSELVRRFYEVLRVDCGIDAILDRVAAGSPQEWTAWMIREMKEADFILCLVSPQYRAAAEAALPADVRRGAQWETRLLRDQFYEDAGAARKRVLAVVLPGRDVDDIPAWRSPVSGTHYRLDDLTKEGAESLLRYLTGHPGYDEPPLGSLVGYGPILALRLNVEPGPTLGSVVVTLTEEGRELARHEGALPTVDPWVPLDGQPEQAAARLAAFGVDLGRALYGGAVGDVLSQAIAATPAGRFVELGVAVGDGTGEVAVEAARLADGRWPVLDPVVQLYRVAGSKVAPLPGPLKVLVAVAAPEETRTANLPLDVEAALAAVMDAVEGLDRSGAAQVRILEVSSLAEIGRALHEDQFHVLHLFGHGSPGSIELEDEDGDPQPATTAELVEAIRQAGRPLPMVFLSSCHGAARSGTGMAAGLVAGGVGSVLAMQTSVTEVYATLLARLLYRELARPGATPAGALAYARTTLEKDRASDHSGTLSRPEFAVATLLGHGGQSLVALDAPPDKLSVVADAAAAGPVPELAVGRLIGRRPELRRMLRALRDDPRSLDEHGARPGVQVLGIGGIGKSALAGRAMARLREEGWAVAAVVGPWSPATLFASVRSAMAGRHLSEGESELVEALADGNGDVGRLRAVAGLLECHRLLTVFDNAEDNLEVGGGSYKDQAFPASLRVLVESCGRGRMLVTSRHPLPGFDDLLAVPVPPLSRSQVERLLRRLGRLRSLGPTDRTMLYRTIGGHPRVLEFVDALLRGGHSDLKHVNAKLRSLAESHGVALSGSADLDEAVQSALAVGARDIVLPELVALLDRGDREALLQLSVSSLPMNTASLANTVDDGKAGPTSPVDVRLGRLVDASLVTPLEDGQFVVHRWTAQALRTVDPDEEAWRARSRRAAGERLRRVNAGVAGLEEVAEAVRNCSDAGEMDEAVRLVAEVASMRLPTMTKAAFLGEVVALVPEDHEAFGYLLDAEARSLIDLGLGPGALARYQALLARHERLAAADPTNAGFQRDLSVSYNRLGDLMVAAGNGTDAERFFRDSLAIAERLAAADPRNVRLQGDVAAFRGRLDDGPGAGAAKTAV